MKGLFLHVGADQSDFTTLGVNAPIFDDGTFEFIPIAEFLIDGTYIVKRGEKFVAVNNGKDQETKVWTTERSVYREIKTRNGVHCKVLSDYLPQDCDSMVPHFDPDFEHYTYGDRQDTSKGKQISKLESGDYILFVSSLAPYIKDAYENKSRSVIRSFQRRKMAKFLIGYFRVGRVFHAVCCMRFKAVSLYSFFNVFIFMSRVRVASATNSPLLR